MKKSLSKYQILLDSMERYYRKANIDDIDQIMEAVEDSREVLRLQGNGQWQDGYPNKNDYINDINTSKTVKKLWNDLHKE